MLLSAQRGLKSLTRASASYIKNIFVCIRAIGTSVPFLHEQFTDSETTVKIRLNHRPLGHYHE